MATPDSTLSTLDQIIIKVRRLTRSMDAAALTDQQIKDYINTFVLYDFPEHLRLFNLQTTFTFFTEPFIDTYESNDDSTSVFYNFKNKYINVNPPVFIAGRQSSYVQSRDQFFAIYPMTNAIATIGTTGNGSQTFSGFISNQQSNIQPFVSNGQFGTILLRNNVLFSSINAAGNSLALVDFPISSTIGNLYVPGATPSPVFTPTNYINYVTGQFVITFSSAPDTGAPINSQTVQLQPNLPQTVLFYQGKFTVRPVPDQAYRINIEAAIRPTELMSNSQSPELAEWWQWIAYGAAKKVLEDRMDLETIQQILPEYKKQELLINRRTIVQQSNQRTPTIFQGQAGGVGYGNGWGNGSSYN